MKALSMSELAVLYFPKSSVKSANTQLKRWIAYNRTLQDELNATGYRNGQRMLTPSFNGPMARKESPRPGISTLMTSAPKSAKSPAPQGAAMTVAISKIRTPANASFFIHAPPAFI